MREYYSVSHARFYDEIDREAYQSNDRWPEDILSITPEQAEVLIQAYYESATVTYVDGQFVITPKVWTQAELNQFARNKINGMEGSTLTNRGVRELHMRIIERELKDTPQALLTQPYYVRLKAADDQIKIWRAEIIE